MADNLLHAMLQSKKLTMAAAPGLVGCVEELARAGKTSVPNIRLVDHGMVNAAYHLASNSIFITKGILHKFDSSNLSQAPSKELRVILAHEMGHKKFAAKHFGPMFLLIGAIPLIGMGGMYLIHKTNERLKNDNSLHPDKPEHFWTAFQAVVQEIEQKGLWRSYRDFKNYTRPLWSKVRHKDLYKDATWSQAIFDQAKVGATYAAFLVPSLAACRPFAMRNEYEADRFAVAVTGNKEDFIHAFEMIEHQTAETLKRIAKSHLERSWGKRILDVLAHPIAYTAMAHPETGLRIETIEKLDLAKAIRSFHL